jgi:hypothetical protein
MAAGCRELLFIDNGFKLRYIISKQLPLCGGTGQLLLFSNFKKHKIIEEKSAYYAFNKQNID